MRRNAGLVILCALWASFAVVARAQTYTFTTIAGTPGTYGSSDGTNSEARFAFPSEIALDESSGALYVSDMLNHTIRKVTPSGSDWVVTTVAGLAGSPGAVDGTNSDARFNRPQGIKVDRFGNLFVCDLYNHMIRQVTPVGTNWVVTTIAGLAAVHGSDDGTNSQARFYSPRGLALEKNGSLAIADSANFAIRGITPEDTNWVVRTLAGEYPYFGFADGTNEWAEFNTPFGIVSAVDLFVADWGNHAIRQITKYGTDYVTTTIAGFSGLFGTNDGPALLAMFNCPAGITVDSFGNLFVTDKSSHTVRKLAAKEWTTSTIAGAALQSGTNDGPGSVARFKKPWGITVDPAGNLFVVDYSNHTIRKGTPQAAGPVITMFVEKGALVLSWPTAASGFVLENTGDLSIATWKTVTEGISIIGDSYFLTNTMTGPAVFFRLRQP